MLWRLGRGGDLDRTDLRFRECPLVAHRGHCRETGLEVGRPGWRRGDQQAPRPSRYKIKRKRETVEKVGLPGAGAEWPRAAREGEGGVCGNLPLGVLGKRTGSLMGLVTNMDSAGSGEGCAQYWPDCNGGS